MTFSELQQKIFDLILNRESSVADHLALYKILPSYLTPPDYFRKSRVAFLSNFTLFGLPEVFKIRGIFSNLWIDAYLAPYNQYGQEFLNPDSGLRKFAPKLVYLILDGADADFEQARNLAEKFGAETKAKVVTISNTELAKNFPDYWNTKYKELGDLRLAPQAFPRLSDQLLGQAIAESGATKKCLVLDLDNTLWKGVVGEDGPEKIVPDRKLQEHILNLYENGAILAINSRNNPEDALAVIEKHPEMLLRPNHFAAQRINWQDKALNLKELADELVLSMDSFVFVDDELFNLASIHYQFPQVVTLAPEMLPEYRGFDSLHLTKEDKRRGQMYAEEFTRRKLRTTLASVEDFLRQLNLEVKIASASEENIARISQLTQKTNQFNLATRRYSEEEIRDLLKRGWKIWTVGAVDRFGDYGIIGVQMVEPEGKAWRVDNFLLSCRILGRGIEKSFLIHMLEQARKCGVREVTAEYIPTTKNKMCENFYQENNFVFDKSGNNRYLYSYKFDGTGLRYPDLIKISFV